MSLPAGLLKVLIRQRKAANDASLIFDMQGAIKAALKYGCEHPGRVAAMTCKNKLPRIFHQELDGAGT